MQADFRRHFESLAASEGDPAWIHSSKMILQFIYFSVLFSFSICIWCDWSSHIVLLMLECSHEVYWRFTGGSLVVLLHDSRFMRWKAREGSRAVKGDKRCWCQIAHFCNMLIYHRQKKSMELFEAIVSWQEVSKALRKSMNIKKANLKMEAETNFEELRPVGFCRRCDWHMFRLAAKLKRLRFQKKRRKVEAQWPKCQSEAF